MKNFHQMERTNKDTNSRSISQETSHQENHQSGVCSSLCSSEPGPARSVHRRPLMGRELLQHRPGPQGHSVIRGESYSSVGAPSYIEVLRRHHLMGGGCVCEVGLSAHTAFSFCTEPLA